MSKITAALLKASLMLLLLNVAVANEEKVAVCHIPPDDPDNLHTIYVSQNAVPAHEAHGDYIGITCEEAGPSYVSLGVLVLMCGGWMAFRWQRGTRPV